MRLLAGRWTPPPRLGVASHNLTTSDEIVTHSVLGLDPAANPVSCAAGGLWCLQMRSTSPHKVNILAAAWRSVWTHQGVSCT